MQHDGQGPWLVPKSGVYSSSTIDADTVGQLGRRWEQKEWERSTAAGPMSALNIFRPPRRRRDSGAHVGKPGACTHCTHVSVCRTESVRLCIVHSSKIPELGRPVSTLVGTMAHHSPCQQTPPSSAETDRKGVAGQIAFSRNPPACHWVSWAWPVADEALQAPRPRALNHSIRPVPSPTPPPPSQQRCRQMV